MLNNDNDLRPAYAFAYVTEPQDTKEEEEVNLSPTVFKWFWIAATVISSVVANKVANDAKKKAEREKKAAIAEAQTQQRNLQDAQALATEQITAQTKEGEKQQEYQRIQEQETSDILAQTKADTEAAIRQGQAQIGQARQESQLSMATAEAQAEQQLALSEGSEQVGTPVGQPGVSFTDVKKPSSLAIGGTANPEETGMETQSGLTI